MTRAFALCLALLCADGAQARDSVCYGRPAHGRLDDGVSLPLSGRNYTAYSSLARTLDRNYVHSRVAPVVIAAYARIAQKTPALRFVYGETGHARGGRIRPHRTHQNGLSVDFMVPVRGAHGVSVVLPTSLGNRYGYDWEFDRNGRAGGYRIDFVALAAHLRALHASAQALDVRIKQVIFDPPYLPRLYATPDGAYLRQHLHFMPRPAWVRHDEHYHVDFDLPCRPLPQL